MTSPAVDARRETQALPLAGKRIVLTRPRAQAGDFEARVAASGGEAVIAPTIAVVPPDTWTVADAALRRAGTYDWIAFTSANAVRGLIERADAIGVARDVLRDRQLAAVGRMTAAAIAATLREPDMVPSVHTAEALGRELVDVANARLLLPRGDLADDALPDTLRARGGFVDEVVVYRTVPGDGLATIVSLLRDGAADALLFTSASAVRFVAQAIVTAGGTTGASFASPVVACLGPVTAQAARAAGFTSVIVADVAGQTELIDRIAQWFARSEGTDGGTG